MTTEATTPLTTSTPSAPRDAREAFLLLRTVFTIAPIAFGLDKFFGVLTDWDHYLVPWINDLVVALWLATPETTTARLGHR